MSFSKPKIDLTPLYKENPLPRIRKAKKKQYIPKVKVIKEPTFKQYKLAVWKLTEDIAHQIPHIEFRGFLSFHIDHKISIHYGYKNDIPIEHIAHISNLEMIQYEYNMKKGTGVCVDDQNKWIIEDNEVK